VKNAIRALALVPLLLLGGCFDYSEEVWVHRDGTGRLKLDVAFLSEMLEPDEKEALRASLQEAAEQLKAHPDVSTIAVSDFVEGPKHHFIFDVTAKRWEALPSIVQADWLTLEQLEGKQVRYVRALNEGSAAALALAGRGVPDLASADDRARDLATRVLSRRARVREEVDFHATFKLHSPKIIDSNGEVSGGDVTWRWRLEEMEEKAPPRLEARLDLSRSYLLPIAAAVGFGFAFLWLKKKWDKRYY
jgi:hypothetical protein